MSEPAVAIVAAAGDAWRGEATLQSEAPLENEVGHLAPMRVQWSLSRDGGATWFSPMPSKNELFVTLAEPQCATLYRTVAYLACGNPGATSADQAQDNTWAMFAPVSGNEGDDVCAWNEATRDYTRPLHYYFDENGLYNTSAAGLLDDADGQCHAWAELLQYALLANNVATGGGIVKVTPKTTADAFGVKNIAFNEPTYPEDAPWSYIYSDDGDVSDLDLAAPGIPGQNVSTPQAKLFSKHFIYLLITPDGTYYDPSYGAIYSGEADFVEQAVGAWGKLTAEGWRWCKKSDLPEETVEFTEP